ncbi:MAG: chemotaxis protein [Campylobacterota bacterium]|nr:chemotaxis protein [Campylobacterota bacterium]
MTQEELDALMSGDIDLDDETEEDIVSEGAEEEIVEEDDENSEEADSPYRVDPKGHYPPPANDDHKVVHQLDDVTKESEEKATEIFDIIENISNELMDEEEKAQSCIEVFQENVKVFAALHEKFPDIETFKAQLEKNQEALDCANNAVGVLQNSGDGIMQVMDIMQYQDIHRQKIERVINVMRALSNYMNKLFEGKIEDDGRVSSATHLPGDKSTEDIVSTDDIEALIASLGNS